MFGEDKHQNRLDPISNTTTTKFILIISEKNKINNQIPNNVKVQRDYPIKNTEHLCSDVESVASNVSCTSHTAHNATSTASALPKIYDNAKRTQHHEETIFYSYAFIEDDCITNQSLSFMLNNENEDVWDELIKKNWKFILIWGVFHYFIMSKSEFNFLLLN